MHNVNPIILVAVLLSIVATGVVVFILIYQKKQLHYLNEKKQMQLSFEKEILESRLEIQEQTMKHISQDVHDNIGQLLSVVKLNLNLMTCDEPLLQEQIRDTTDLVGKAIRDLRDLSKSLHSDIITSAGLMKAIEYEFGMLKKTGAYITSLTIEGEPYTLPEHKELILFRIFQEAVNNTIKHAKATLIEVKACFYIDKFLLYIKDNGQGFDSQVADINNGLGIRNIMNRSQLIGAFYHIDSQPGAGTGIKIELPVTDINPV